MDEEIYRNLRELMTSANHDLMEMVAVLEALIRIMEGENPDETALYLTQKLVKKVFNYNSMCKTILNLNE